MGLQMLRALGTCAWWYILREGVPFAGVGRELNRNVLSWVGVDTMQRLGTGEEVKEVSRPKRSCTKFRV